jgi:hypothetical protein
MNKTKKIFHLISQYINEKTVRNIFYFSGGIIVFIGGVILYGVILNLRDVPLSEVMRMKGPEELFALYI